MYFIFLNILIAIICKTVQKKKCIYNQTYRGLLLHALLRGFYQKSCFCLGYLVMFTLFLKIWS